MATQKFVQAQKFKLAGSGVTATATSIELVDFNMPNGDAIVVADLGTTNYATIEPGTSNEEIISFTGVTSVTLTGVTRGLDFASPYTAVAGNRKAHAGGSILVITNNPQVYQDLLSASNDETITGKHTYTTVPASTAAPTAGNDLVNLTKLNATALGTTNIDQTIVAGTAGETVAAGEMVYFDATDKEWKLTDASASATSENVLLGVAQGAGTNGNPISGGVLRHGLDKNQSGMTVGAKQFLSDTGGALAESAGTKEISIGFARTATELYFAPRYDQQITEDEQDALAGSSGTPSASNKYITADDVSDAAGSGKIVRASGTALPALSGASVTAIATANITGTLTDGSDADALHRHNMTIGQATRVNGDGTGTQDIAHGLGVVPKLVKITAMWNAGTTARNIIISFGHATVAGDEQSQSAGIDVDSTENDAQQRQLSGAGRRMIDLFDSDGGGKGDATLSALNSTNITLDWQTAVDAGGTCLIQWEAWA